MACSTELARANLYLYLQQRAWGELEKRQSMFDAVRHPERKPPPAKPLQGPCPDNATLDRYLGGLLHMLNAQFHEAAATFELVPAWLRFLEAKQLLSPEQRQKTLQGLRPMHATLLKFFATYRCDPALHQALQAWGGEETSGQSP